MLIERKKDRILLTRSFESNLKLKQKLNDKNLDLFECNLLEYKLLPIDLEIIKQFSGIIITSNFAAQNIPISPYYNMPAYVVGEDSANILSAKKYKIEITAPNATILKNKLDVINKKLIYLSSNHITVKMPTCSIRKIYYEVKYLSSLANKQIEELKLGMDYILLYSENCAKTLLKLHIENDLINFLTDTTIIAISLKVGTIFEKYCRKIIIADNSSEMLKILLNRSQC